MTKLSRPKILTRAESLYLLATIGQPPRVQAENLPRTLASMLAGDKRDTTVMDACRWRSDNRDVDSMRHWAVTELVQSYYAFRHLPLPEAFKLCMELRNTRTARQWNHANTGWESKKYHK